MSTSTESEFLSLQKRVQHLEKKLKTWSRVFRQETLWKHNLEEWLIQNFDYNVRLQTELGFFKSSDEEDEKDDLGTGNATKALAKLASKRHLGAVPNLIRRGSGSGVQIISCQANATVFPVRENSDELYIKKRRLNSFEEGHTIDIGSTTVSTVNPLSNSNSSSGRYSQSRNTNPIISSSNNQLNNNRFTIQEVEPKSATNNFSISNSNVVKEIVNSNTIILNSTNSSFEYETEESYLPGPSSSARRKVSKEEVLSSQEDNEITTSNRQFSISRASVSDNATSNDVLVVSDDSDSSSVVFLNNYETDSANKPPVNYTHQCTTCGRRISTEGPSFSHFLKIEETTCFICQIEQINQRGENLDRIAIDADILHTSHFGIIELLANSGIEMDSKIVKKALVKCEHWSECARLLIRNYFPREVLLRSNAKGGERKVPGGDGIRHEPLDENVVYVLKNFVKDFWVNKGGIPIEVDKGFNRVVNKVCQRERDKVKRKQTMEEQQVNTSFFQQLEINLQQNN